MPLIHRQAFICRAPSVVVIALLVNLAAAGLSFAGEFSLSKQILANTEEQYGDYARRRLVAWRNLINQNATSGSEEKLQVVNNFFNSLEFTNDIDHWGKEEYQAYTDHYHDQGDGAQQQEDPGNMRETLSLGRRTLSGLHLQY